MRLIAVRGLGRRGWVEPLLIARIAIPLGLRPRITVIRAAVDRLSREARLALVAITAQILAVSIAARGPCVGTAIATATAPFDHFTITVDAAFHPAVAIPNDFLWRPLVTAVAAVVVPGLRMGSEWDRKECNW